jgi:hypothetical protein
MTEILLKVALNTMNKQTNTAGIKKIQTIELAVEILNISKCRVGCWATKIVNPEKNRRPVKLMTNFIT